MATAPATVADFKARFTRDFVYGTALDSVRDQDIQNGIDEAVMLFNPCLFSTSEAKVAFLYAAAHLMVTAIQGGGGLATAPSNRGLDSRGGGVIGQKTVGSVSVAYAGMDTWVAAYPVLAGFLKTDYGQKYLDLLKPRLVGNVAVVDGPRDPDIAVPNIPFGGP